jgi:ferritin-like metal-binding protein YciE
MKYESLKDLYLNEVRDIYDAESVIVKALPKMADAASSPELRNAFLHHLEQTKGHVARLEQIFEGMGEKPKPKKCEGVRGIIDEGEDLMSEKAEPSVMDAGLIAGAQRVEHYEIAVYGSLRTWAQRIGNSRDVSLLEQTLHDEKDADQKLTQIAEQAVNRQAAASA